MESTPSSSLHVVLFPFMAKGHTIPILDLARLLLRRNATVTLFTTPANLPFISTSLSHTTTTIIPLPFPENIPGIPSGVESTDKLPSMSLFVTLAESTKLMKPQFETALQSLHPPVTFMVTDGFFGWTLDSANKFNIPRLVYYGMSNFAITINRTVSQNPQLLFENVSDNELVSVPQFPWLKVTRNDFDDSFTGRDPDSPHTKWVTEQIIATAKSYGLITNSFFELEPAYASYWNLNLGPKSWSVGPFIFGIGNEIGTTIGQNSGRRPPWMVWLDEKLERGSPVLYVAFGSQAEISGEQLDEIEIGLEKSEVNFLWVVRRDEKGVKGGFEERVKGRGIVVREWVNQREILGHESVMGFLSHCGWNSVVESIWAKVPILAWPMAAEQPLNARFVVEERKIGVRVERDARGFVKWEGLEKAVRELMEGERGKEARKNMKEVGDAAVKAVEEGGSSWRSLNELIHELQEAKSCVNGALQVDADV